MRSLRARLIIAFVVPTAILVVVLVAVAYDRARQGLEAELEERLKSVGQVISAEMSDGVDAAQLSRLDESMPRVHAGLQRRLQAIQGSTGVERIFLFDASARSLVDTDGAGFQGEVLYRVEADREAWEQGSQRGEAVAGPLFRDDEGRFHKTAYAPIRLEGQTVAVVGVVASADYFVFLRQLALVLTLLGVFGLVVVLGVAFWFSALLVRPVDALVEAAGRLADGQMEGPVESSPGQTQELEFLTRSFEEMRRSIVARDEEMQMMLAGIAHEVRNPLGGMELFCGLLKEDLRDGGDSGQVVMVEKIERELTYLSRVVSDFLSFARPTELSLERLSAAELFDEIRELCAGDLLAAECEVVVVGDQTVELTVDVGQFRRALLNVVRNAWQACPAGSQILLSAEAEGDLRRVRISDDGPGIDEEDMGDLCRPFFTTREKGSGLGLSLTRRIVEGHGGALEIRSEVGKGTTIELITPFVEGVESGRETPEQAIPEGWLG